MKKRPSYREAVEWIAVEDEPLEMDPGVVAQMIIVALVADLWGVTVEEAAADVVRYRQKGSMAL